MDSAGVPEELTVQKLCILSLAVGFITFGIAKVLIPEGTLGWAVVRYLFAVVTIGSTYIWCLFDNRQNAHAFGKYMLVLFVLLLPLGLAVYFYRSRGLLDGSIALMKASTLFIILLAAGAVSGVLISRILGILF